MGGYARNLYSRSRVKEPRGKTLLSYRMAANPPSTCAHPLHPLQSMSETEERLAFEVLGASSEDPNHPAQNLLQYSEDGRGWRSEQGQPTPQDLDLKFSGTIRLAPYRAPIAPMGAPDPFGCLPCPKTPKKAGVLGPGLGQRSWVPGQD